ncbi:hypothetical protein KKF84_16675 [Myxococcota bacterium]|nr:hypothetical protein [Myxococcota bacterium]
MTDQGININRFNQDFNALLAKCMNAKLKRKGTFWEPGDVGDTRLITPQDIIEKAIYSLANPVSAGIVKRAHQDCSRISRIGDIGAPGDALKRPHFYFRTNSQMQKDATLRLCVPNAFSDSPIDYRQNLWERLFARENEIAVERGHRGFMGKKNAMKISAFDRPREDLVSHTLNPRIACCDPKLMRKEKKALRAFRRAYREARAAWLQGDRSVLFPPGTWAMMFFHGAKTMTFKEDILIL